MEILQTRRLTFRHLEAADLNDLFALYQDPDMRRYIPDAPTTLTETQEQLAWFENGHPRHPELGLWATILKETNRFIGRCGLLPWTIDGRFEVEVAYMIDKAHWGQGLGTEAASGIRDYAFGRLGLTRLICLIDRDNQASIRVAKKIGMAFEKDGEDDVGPFQLYAMAAPNQAESRGDDCPEEPNP